MTVTQADAADPDAVLSAPGVSGLLDFTRPVAVLALGVLDIIHTPDAAGLVRRYRDACAPGSALELLEPGVAPTAAWRPDEPVGEQEAARSNAYAAAGILR